MSQLTDATGKVTTFGYDTTALRSLTSNGSLTTFGYDTSRRLSAWTFGSGSPAASNWAASYDSTIKTTITDGNNNAAVYTIAGSRTTIVADPLGNITTSKWVDGTDSLLERTDVMGGLTLNEYNANNLVQRVTSPAGAAGGAGAFQSLSFPTPNTNAPGGDYQPTGATDAQGNTKAIGYDANTGQANQVTGKDAAGVAIGGAKTSTIQGDGAGTNCGAKNGEVCTTSNGNGNVTSYGYTAGNPTSITAPAPLGVRAFTYDGAGRVLSGTDGRGNTTRYAYDGNDRTTEVSQGATGCLPATCVSYTYDGAGNLTGRTSPTGATAYTYDGLNRPVTKTQAGVLVSTAAYDKASNLTGYTDTTGTIGYGYDSANRLVSLAEPGGSCPVGVTTPNSTGCTVFGYDYPTRTFTTKFPTGQVTTKISDGAGRATSLTAKTAAGAVLASRAYTYQGATTPEEADQALRASMTDQSGKTDYGYDGMNRLNKATTEAPVISTWEYDNDGNRTKATKTGTPSVYSVFNGADQLCWSSTTAAAGCADAPTGATTYTYDGNGNQTSDQVGDGPALVNSFNVFNQLTDTLIGGATTLTSTYADTGNTERLTAGATSFINGTLGVTTATKTGTATSFIRDPFGNLIAMRTAGQSYYYTSDVQGSVIALTDATQALVAAYTYDPWGNTTTSTGPLAASNPWRYATSYTDPETGYLKLGARYYNPTTARFTQPDPSNQEANTYNYASCNPANNTDPSGLFGWGDAWNGLSAAAGMVQSCVTGGALVGGLAALGGSVTGPGAIVFADIGFAVGCAAGMTSSKYLDYNVFSNGLK